MKGVKNIKAKKTYITAALYAIIIYSLIANHTEIKDEILKTVTMWCTVLIPSLFPYLVLSKYLSSSETMELIAKALGPVIGRIIKTGKNGIKVFICSLFCGYPSGALCTADLLKSSAISQSEAHRLICFTNNAGPLFVISAIGTSMLKNTADGIAIYCIQTASAILYAFFSGKKTHSEKHNFSYSHPAEKTDFCNCVKSAVTAIINIGGFIVCTVVICKIIILFLFGILNHTEYQNFFMLEAYVYSVFEISVASAMISALPKTAFSFAFLCATVSWSGISVILQVKSVLPPQIKISRFIAAKFIQAAVSFFLGFAYKTFIHIRPVATEHNLIFISFVFTVVIFILYVFMQRISCSKK